MSMVWVLTQFFLPLTCLSVLLWCTIGLRKYAFFPALLLSFLTDVDIASHSEIVLYFLSVLQVPQIWVVVIWSTEAMFSFLPIPSIEICRIYWCFFISFRGFIGCSLHQKAAIHQVTTMLATSKNVLFPGHNHLLTDDPTLWLSPKHRWGLAGGYDQEIAHFFKWPAWWLPDG